MILFDYSVRIATPISELHGVGKVFLELLHEANIKTVGDARQSTVSAIQNAITRLRQQYPDIADPVWYGRGKRVCSIIERLEESSWVESEPPEAFMCAICADWLVEPKRLPTGQLVCHYCIQDWLDRNPTNPFTRQPITMNDLNDESKNLKPLIRTHRDAHDELIVRRRRDTRKV